MTGSILSRHGIKSNIQQVRWRFNLLCCVRAHIQVFLLIWMLPLVAILINTLSILLWDSSSPFSLCSWFVVSLLNINGSLKISFLPCERIKSSYTQRHEKIIKCGFPVSIGIVPLGNFQDIPFSFRWFFFMTDIYHGYLLVMLILPTLRLGWKCYRFMVCKRDFVHWTIC